MLEAVVSELGGFRDEVVFLGGSIVGLLITEAFGDPVRETTDVDCIVELSSSFLSFRGVELKLQELGWTPGAHEVEGDPSATGPHSVPLCIG